MTTPDHTRVRPWLPTADGLIVAVCSCGWQSKPCTNGEFANQEWERHSGAANVSTNGESTATP
jgi:hypothetical protein